MEKITDFLMVISIALMFFGSVIALWGIWQLWRIWRD